MKRLLLVNWRFLALQVMWAFKSQIFSEESTELAKAIDDEDLPRARELLAQFEALISDRDHPEVIQYRTTIEFLENWGKIESELEGEFSDASP